MKRFKGLKLTVIMLAFVLIGTGCSKPSIDSASLNEESASDSNQALTVEIKDYYGTVKVPVNPKNVVALDNRTFETLADWDIQLAAVPKAVMLSNSPYVSDDKV